MNRLTSTIGAIVSKKLANAKALLHYPFIINQARNKQMFFFFPFWCIGGAERVHGDILKAFSGYPAICFITEKSPNQGFKQDFINACSTVELGRWSEKLSFRKVFQKKIASVINSQKNPVVFGCNSKFFYDLLPFLHGHVKVIDLIHAFSDGKGGFEWYSLPLVQRISKRVVLGNKTRTDFQNQYNSENVPPHLLERLVIIPNRVNTPMAFKRKDINTPALKILFVARNSYEKRVNLFLEIANSCFKKSIPVKFYMIGDFDSLSEMAPPNTTIVGELHDRTALNNYYEQCHLLLITSFREGFPMVILEGMSYGVIPLTTDVGEIPAYISPQNMNGFLIHNHNNTEEIVSDFVEKISYLADNRDLLHDYAEGSYLFVKKHFSPEQFIDAYRKLLLTNTDRH